jgi:hypothetical protein
MLVAGGRMLLTGVWVAALSLSVNSGLWGRLLTCGGLAIRLPRLHTHVGMVAKRGLARCRIARVD